MKKYNPRLKKIILEVVDKQLRSNEIPEVKETFKRIISEGFSNQEAKKMIGAVLVAEIYYILKNERVFDTEKYISALKRLPELPGDDYD